MPELAKVNVTAAAGGPSARAAHDAATDLAERIRASVTDVPDDRIRTVDRQVEDTEEPFTAENEERYQATDSLRIDCVPGTAGAAVVSVADAGATVQSVEFHFHQERRQELESAALTAATRRARERAEGIAAAEGLAVGDLLEATTVDSDPGGFESIVDDALGPDADIEPTPIAVTQTVEATFELVDDAK